MTGVIRAPRPERGYFDVKNETVRDSRLSYRARGVLLRLLSNSDGFRMTAVDVAREGKEGRDAVLACFSELRTAGYMVTRRTRDGSGRWSTETYVYDTPQSTEVGKPDAGKPGPDFPASGFPASGSPDSGESGAIQNHDSFLEEQAAAPSGGPSTRRKRGDEVVQNGVELWTACDFQQHQALIEKHGAAEIERLAARLAVRQGHQAPLISDMRAALQDKERKALETSRLAAEETKKKKHDESVLAPHVQRSRAELAIAMLRGGPA